MAPQLTLRQRIEILSLFCSNRTVAEISRIVGVTRRTIYKWLHRYQAVGSVDRLQRTEFARATSSAQDLAIVEAHSSDPFLGTTITAREYSISMGTVRNRLHEAGLHYRVPASKLALSNIHKEDRVSFCLQYYNFDWENNIVIFVDEKSFKSEKDGRKILWRKNNERYDEKNILPNRLSGRISLGFWGWMSSMGPGEIVEINGRMNATQYIEILRDSLLPTVRACYPEGRIYLAQDNCSVHCGRVVQDWLEAQSDIELIKWPAKSPDLNPIENLWGQMVLN